LRLIDFVYHSTLGLRVIKQNGTDRASETQLPRGALPTLLFKKHQTFHCIGIAAKSARGVSLSDEGARGDWARV